MEARLQSLRDQVRLDNMRREEAGQARGKDGSMWQSGSTNRGTLYRYSKQSRGRDLKSTGHAHFVPGEVEERKKRERRARKAGRSSQKPQRQNRGYSSSPRVDGGNLNALMSLDAQVSRYQPSSGTKATAAATATAATSSSHRGSARRGQAAPVPSSRDAGASSSSFSSSSSSPSSSSYGNAAEWSIEGVASWLNEIGMRQYQRTFEKNEIAGSILLDLDPDDLDYMNIKVLAHRKTLMKEINKLKAPPMPATKQVKHWSHVEPLANRKVSGGTMVGFEP